ncbi:MAG: hypothetical protein AAGG48_23500 [Planctomycetota bacterium]
MSENESNPTPSDPLMDPAASPDPASAPPNVVNPYQAPVTASGIGAIPTTVDPSGLRMTRLGLFSIYYGICAILFAFIFGVLFGVVAGVMELEVAALAGIGLLAIVGLGGYLATLVGQVMCITVPRESGSKGFALSSVCLQAASILVGIGGFVATLFLINTSVPAWVEVSSSLLSLVNTVLSLIGYACFLFFLKHLSLHIDRPDLAASSLTVFKLMVFCSASVLVLPFVAGFTAFVSAGAMAAVGILMLIWLLVVLITFVKYANIVVYVARAIPK